MKSHTSKDATADQTAALGVKQGTRMRNGIVLLPVPVVPEAVTLEHVNALRDEAP